ncbi:chemotaxis protein CheB [Daejeonella oryzae]|uniref:chemotaxis protein CheB n=1 Tax=Daejeonella oryzae TaxID=1122943 RepID=UPI000424A2D7|nr:chemotaxis protein CheB [Daejeonella oryzae]
MNNLNPAISAKIKNAKILLIGGSAGGFAIIYDLLLRLPQSFPLPVLVVIHRSKKYKSVIEEQLDIKGKLRVKMAEDKERIQKGTVYFAPPDYHLLVEQDGSLSLDNSEPVHYSRPAIDATFQAAADVYKKNVIAVLLSGANEDGAEGIAYVSELNGLTIVQDPQVAEVKVMPQAAINKANVDLILNNEQIAGIMNTINKINTTIL